MRDEVDTAIRANYDYVIRALCRRLSHLAEQRHITDDDMAERIRKAVGEEVSDKYKEWA